MRWSLPVSGEGPVETCPSPYGEDRATAGGNSHPEGAPNKKKGPDEFSSEPNTRY